MIKTFCELNNITPVTDLKAGMDFRLPEYREEVFMRFYEFHLEYKAHAGAVYLMFPYLAKRLDMTLEQKYWFAFINGITQHAITTLLIYERWNSPEAMNLAELQAWLDENWTKIGFDADRKYVKAKLVPTVERYCEIMKRFGSQTQFFARVCNTSSETTNFHRLWKAVIENFTNFGRLSTFSYLEYLRIMGLNIDCDSLFLDDIGGSMSHRNGLMKVSGRDDLDWHKSNPGFTGHTQEHIEFAKNRGADLLALARSRFAGREFYRDVGYFTLETALCCYKSWHRPNRRYANCYHDMFADRIWDAERKWEREFDLFWEARASEMPIGLRLEDNLDRDCGLKTTKMNWYRETGDVPMMGELYECFQSQFHEEILAHPELSKRHLLSIKT